MTTPVSGRIREADAPPCRCTEPQRPLLSAAPAAGGWAGGAVIVINGTGAGQWRRVVTPGIGAEASNPHNRTWVLDRPFRIPPQVGPGGSFVQILPFRGRSIFSGDTWEDGGAFQFYGHALDNIIAGERSARGRQPARRCEHMACPLYSLTDC
jgi:hypothetical protein